VTLEEYFQTPQAERILLIEIVRNDASSTTYYLSDSDYITEHDDTPSNLFYSPVIGGTGLSDIRKVLNDPFSGQASTGFGEITLVDDQVWTSISGSFSEETINLVRGATVTAWLAGPPRVYSRVDAIQLLKGKVGRVGGSSDGSLRFEIVDGSQELQRPIVAVSDKPLCFGYCRNVQPFLTNPASLEYHVHDGAIEAVVAVYDQGALLTLTTDYTVDLSTGKITLVGSPVGIVTADVKGAQVSGTWLDSTEEIASELISRAVVSIAQTYNIPTGVVGLYVTESTALGDLLNRLMVSCAAYWLIDENNEFLAAQYPVPQESTAVGSFTSLSELSEVRYQAEDRLYSDLNYSYRKNWTQYQSRPAASTAQASFSERLYLSATETAAGLDSELEYQESPFFETLFDEQADAQAVSQRLLSIYAQERKLLEVDLPYTAALKLGDNISVEFGVKLMIGAVVSVIDIFDGGYPIQRVMILV
jgi:hypothetical protein